MVRIATRFNLVHKKLENYKMRFKKGESLPIEETVFPIDDHLFIEAYIAAFTVDPSPSYGRLKPEPSFLRTLLSRLNINTPQPVPKELQNRLKNKFSKLQPMIKTRLQKIKG